MKAVLNALVKNRKIILYFLGCMFVIGLLVGIAVVACLSSSRFTEQDRKEMSQAYVDIAVAEKVTAIKPKVNEIMEAMAYNDFITAEVRLWELSTYLEEGE